MKNNNNISKKIISRIMFFAFLSISLIILLLWPKSESIDYSNIRYEESQFNSLLSTDPINRLKYSYDDNNEEAVLTDFDFTGVNSENINSYFAKILVVPKTVQRSIDGNVITYNVVGIDFNRRESNSETFYSAAQLVKAVKIPTTITSIGEGSFWGFGSIVYFESPFVGTERGSSAYGMDSLGQSKPFVSMFINKLDPTKQSFYGFNIDNYNDRINALTAIWYEDKKPSGNLKSFYYPGNLQKVVITDDTAIGNHALFNLGDSVDDSNGVGGVSSIEIRNTGNLRFGIYAMAENPFLETVILPQSNTSVSVGMFGHCFNLKSVKLPAGITEIPEAMFEEAKNLTSVLMPSSVESIGKGAFYGCNELSSIELFNESWDNKIQSSESIALPSGLQIVGKDAFYNCFKITSIIVPNNVIQIGANAFGGCVGLTSITLPFVGAHSGDSHNSDCNSADEDYKYHGLFGYIFSKSTATQGTYLASQMYDITNPNNKVIFNIPNNLRTIIITNDTSISFGAFQSLKSVNTIIINDLVTTIASGSFKDCIALTDLSIPFVTGAHLGVMFGTTTDVGSANDYLTLVSNKYYIPKSLVNIKITNQHTILTGTFNDCTMLKKVEISKNTQVMNEGIFFNNPLLEEIIIPFVGISRGEFYQRYWWWRDLAFRNTAQWIFSSTTHSSTYANETLKYYSDYIKYIPNSLRSITVTDETVIGTYSFRNFKSLTSINITNNVSSIENGAMNGCSNLVSITVPYIGQTANLTGVSGSKHVLGWFFGSSKFTNSYMVSQFVNYYIPQSLKSVTIGTVSNKIFGSAFKDAASIATITTYAPISEIGTYAFYGCVNLSTLNTPNAIYTNVADYAFYNCQNILNIEEFIPKTVTTIGNYAFSGTSVGSGFNKLNLEPYTSIGNYAFSNCLRLESIVVPVSINLGEGVFADCQYLKTATLYNKKLTKYLFKNCISLDGIDITGITEIPDGAFYGCKSLKSQSGSSGLILDPSLVTIGNHAFYGCEGLESFVLSNKTTSIGTYAFYGCTGLEYMTIPKEMKVINSNAWDECDPNFFFYSYLKKEDWPNTWIENWNCYYPVYIIGYMNESLFTYEYVQEFKGYRITGVEDGVNLEGIINIPSYHNGLKVVSISSSGKNPFTALKDITTIVLPSTIFEIADYTFANGQRVDIYTELLKSEVEKLYSDSHGNKGWQINIDESNFISYGLVFYKNDWQYGVGDYESTPYIKATSLKFDFDLSLNILIYNGREIKPTVSSITLPAIFVNNSGLSEEIINEIRDLTVFTYSYKNNVQAGKAQLIANLNEARYKAYNQQLTNKVLIVGTGLQEFTIQKASVDLFMTDNIFVNTTFTTTYSGKTTSISSFGSYVQGLESFSGSTFSGTLSTTREIVGTYSYNSVFDDINGAYDVNNGNFVWTKDWNIYRNGVRITDNFNIHLYLTIEIKPLDVVIDWTGGEWDENNDFYLYKYTGEIIEPQAVALDALTKSVVKNCAVIAATNGTTGKLPSDVTSYKAYAYLVDNLNYRLVKFDEATNSYVEVTTNIYNGTTRKAYETNYKITKGLVIVNLNIDYTIGSDEDYWSLTLSEKSSYVSGIGPNSLFSGTLKTSGDTQTNYIYGSSGAYTIDWLQSVGKDGVVRNFHIYQINSEGQVISEMDYYDISVTATVRIKYNVFDVSYVVTQLDNQNQSTYKPNVVEDNGRSWVYLTYSVDGNDYQLTVIPNNYSSIVPYEVSYFKTEDESQIVGKDGLRFKEVGTYTIGVTISARHFETYHMNIKLTTIKSNYTFSSFSREYNRYKIDPFAEGMVLKYDQNHDLTFTYYNPNKTIQIPAPSEIGKYSVHVTAPSTPYFNSIDVWFNFEITKRQIVIDISGSQSYDGSKKTWTPDTNDLISAGYLLGSDDMYNSDSFIGTLSTYSNIPGEYSSSSVLWTVSWGVYDSVTNENHSSNYEIVILGIYEIKYNIIAYNIQNYTGDFDGTYHTGFVNVSDPLNSYTIYYSESEITQVTDLSKYSKFSFTYSEPGEYKVYFVIIAANYEEAYGYYTVTINELSINYHDPATDDAPYDTYVVDYTGTYQQYKVTVNSPWNAIVYYSLDGITWDTTAFEYRDVGNYFIYYKIEASNHISVEATRIQFVISEDNLNELDTQTHYVTPYDGKYDGQTHSVNVVAPLPTGSNFIKVYYSLNKYDENSWTTTNYLFKDANLYEVFVKIVAQGYKTKIYSSYVNITKLTFEDITITDYKGVYDGLSHMVSINGLDSKLENGVVNYYYNGILVSIGYTSNQDVLSASYGWLDNLSYTNVGKYKVWVKVSADNYEDLILGDGLSIGFVEITTLNNPTGRIEYQEIEYSEYSDKSLEILTSHDGVRRYYYYLAYEENGVLKCDFTNRTTTPQELGLYYVRVEFLASKNCVSMILDSLNPDYDQYLTENHSNTDNFFRIVPKVLNVKWNESYDYDGNSHSPNPTVETLNGDQINILYELISPSVEFPIEVGTYVFSISIYQNNPNYVLDRDEITMTIIKRVINVELYEEKEYDGKVWRRDSDWNLLGLNLLSGHEFVATMQTNYTDVADYFYSSLNSVIYSNKVIVSWDIIDSKTGLSVKDYYIVTLDIIISITNPKIDLSSIQDTVFDYDGKPHTVVIDLTGSLNGAVIMYKQEEGEWTRNPVPQVYAGEYSFEIQVSKPGFDTTTGSAKLIINKTNLVINIDPLDNPDDTADDAYSIYDGLGKTVTYQVTNVYNYPEATKDVGSVRYYPVNSVTIESLHSLYKNFNINSPIYNRGLTEMVNASDYYAVVYYEDTANKWNASYQIKLVTVKQKDINVTLTKPFVYQSEYNKSKVSIYLKDAVIDTNALLAGHYISSSLALSTVRTNSADSKVYNPKTDFEFGDIFIDDGYGNNVSQNYHPVLSDNVFVEILKTYLTAADFIVSDLEKEYDGLINSPHIQTNSDGQITYTFYYYPNGDTSLNPILCTPSNFQVDVGIYYVAVSIGEGTNYYASDVVDPRTGISVGTLYAQVHVIKKTQEVTWDNLEVIFNGSYQTAEAYFYDVYNNLVNLEVFYYDENDNIVYGFIESGSYQASARLKSEGTYGKNYELANPQTTFNINKITYEIRLGDESNNSVSSENSQSKWSMVVNNEMITNFPSNLVLKSNLGQAARLYTVSNLPGIYSGSSRFEFDIRVYTETGLDVTDSISFDVYGSVVILASQITFTTNNRKYTYAQGKEWSFSETNALSITYPATGTSITYVVNGESTIMEPKFSDVGVYLVEFTIMVQGSQIYSPVSGYVTIEIVQKQAYLEFNQSLSKEYDGVAVSPENIDISSSSGFNGTIKDLNFTYYEIVTNSNGDKEQILIGEAPVDAGTYMVRITSDNDLITTDTLNYTELDATQEFTIRPKKLNLSVDENILVENSDLNTVWRMSKKLEATNTDLMSGDVLDFEIYSDSNIIRNTFTAKKSFYATTSTVQTNNFTALLKKSIGSDYTFTLLWKINSSSRTDSFTNPLNISKNYYINLDFKLYVHYEEITANVTGKDVNYDGLSHHGSITIINPVSQTSLTQQYSLDSSFSTGVYSEIDNFNLRFTNPGTYKVYYIIEADQYESLEGHFTITIAFMDREVTIDSELTKIYDEKAMFSNTVPGSNYYLPDFSVIEKNGKLDDYNPANIKILYQKVGSNEYIDPTIGCINAGTYVFTLIIPQSTLYKETVITNIKFIITQRTIYVNDKEDNVKYEYSGGSASYNDFSSTSKYSLTQINNDGTTEPLSPGLTIVGFLITSGKNVGVYEGSTAQLSWYNYEYKVEKAGVDVSSNYRVSLINASIEIVPADMVFENKTTSVGYDGKAHTLVLEMIKPLKYDSIYYYDSVTKSYVSGLQKFYNVGDNETTIRIVASNYNTVDIVLNVTIERSIPDIQILSNLSQEYNGQEVVIPESFSPHAELQITDYIFQYYEWDNKIGSYLLMSVISWDKATSSWKVLESYSTVSRPVNVGKYLLVVTIPESNNFQGLEIEQEFEITTKSVDITWENTVVTYNGQSQSPKATFTLGAYDNTQVPLIYTFSQVSKGDPLHKNVGVYQVSVSIDETKYIHQNYNINTKTSITTFSIQARTITIGLNATKQYGQLYYQFKYNDPSSPFYAINIASEQTISGILQTKSGNNKVNKYTSMDNFEWVSTPTGSLIIYDNMLNDVTSNYIVKYNLSLIINYSDIQVSADAIEVVYDGNSHSIKVTVETLGDFIIYYSSTGAANSYTQTNPSYVNVRMINNKITPYIIYYKVERLDGSDSVSGFTTITIIPASANIELVDPNQNPKLDKIYDGQEVVSPAIKYDSISGSGARQVVYTYYRIVNGVVSNVALTNNPKDAGTYKLIISVAGDSNGQHNYIDSKLEYEFTIEKRQITIYSPKVTKIYDNKVWKLEVNDSIVNNLIPGHLITKGLIKTISLNVGRYYTTDDFTFENGLKIFEGGLEVSDNYEVSYDLDVTITNAPINAIGINYLGTYDGKDHTILGISISDATVTDSNGQSYIISKPVDYTITYSLTRNGVYSQTPIYRKSVGITNIYFKITANNYETFLGEASIEITGINVPGIDDDAGDADSTDKVNLIYDSNFMYSGSKYTTPYYNSVSTGNQIVTYYNASEYKIGNYTNPMTSVTEAGYYVFVIYVETDGVYEAFEVKQSFEIKPKEISVIWDNILYEFNSGKKPTATYTDVFGKLINCDVEFEQELAGAYQAHATTNSNYKIINPTSTVTIVKKKVPELMIDPTIKIEYGEDLVIKDTDGNIYIIDNEGNIIEIQYSNGLVDTNPDLPYRIIVDLDKNADGVKQSYHTIKVEFKDTDNDGYDIKNNYEWEKIGNSESIDVDYVITPMVLPNDKYYLEYEYQYQWIWDSKYTEIKPEVVIYIVDKTTKQKVIKLELDVDYTLSYSNNKGVTTQENLALIQITGINNYSFTSNQKFQILAQVPSILGLKDDSIIKFIIANYSQTDGVTIIEDSNEVFERTLESKNQYNYYLGHLYQNVIISNIVSQFSNDQTKLKVFDYDGNEILAENYSNTYFGTGYTIRLYDDELNEIDSISAILFGDLNGDGMINANDYVVTSSITLGDASYDTMLQEFYFAGIVDRNNMVFVNAISLSKISAILSDSTDINNDFNYNYKPNL